MALVLVVTPDNNFTYTIEEGRIRISDKKAIIELLTSTTDGQPKRDKKYRLKLLLLFTTTPEETSWNWMAFRWMGVGQEV